MHVNTFEEYVRNIARTGLGCFAQPADRKDMTVFSFGHHESSAQCLRDFLCMEIAKSKLPFGVMKSVSVADLRSFEDYEPLTHQTNCTTVHNVCVFSFTSKKQPETANPRSTTDRRAAVFH